MTNTWRLDSLPCEVLLIIFDYCNAFDLVRLSEVCKRFYEIIRTDAIWIKKSKKLLVTNQMSERFRRRCIPVLSPCVKLFVSCNWQYGRYKKTIVHKHKAKLMPWLQMTNDTLWWSGGNHLRGFERTEESTVKSNNNNCFYNQSYGNDICKFVLWRDFIISGHMNGNINYWLNTPNKNRQCTSIVKTLTKAHCCDINAIDATSRNIISGANCGILQIRRNVMYEENTFDEERTNLEIRDKVLSLAIDPTETKVAVGTSAINNILSLHIIDIESCTWNNSMWHKWKHGAGILDMVWDNPHILLTCGYDTYIRKWDMRIGECVSSWADPTDATLYCISSDYQYTMITGTQYNSMAVLWDQRKSDFVQLYYANRQSTCRSSPIYSLRFDSSNLYCATDQYLTKLNFSDHSRQKFDYKYYFPEKTRKI